MHCFVFFLSLCILKFIRVITLNNNTSVFLLWIVPLFLYPFHHCEHLGSSWFWFTTKNNCRPHCHTFNRVYIQSNFLGVGQVVHLLSLRIVSFLSSLGNATLSLKAMYCLNAVPSTCQLFHSCQSGGCVMNGISWVLTYISLIANQVDKTFHVYTGCSVLLFYKGSMSVLSIFFFLKPKFISIRKYSQSTSG